MSNENNSSGGISFLGMLFILFLALKLTNYIGWSWWWVTAPLWGIPAIFIVSTILFLLFIGFVELVTNIVNKIKSKGEL